MHAGPASPLVTIGFVITVVLCVYCFDSSCVAVTGAGARSGEGSALLVLSGRTHKSVRTHLNGDYSMGW